MKEIAKYFIRLRIIHRGKYLVLVGYILELLKINGGRQVTYIAPKNQLANLFISTRFPKMNHLEGKVTCCEEKKPVIFLDQTIYFFFQNSKVSIQSNKDISFTTSKVRSSNLMIASKYFPNMYVEV